MALSKYDLLAWVTGRIAYLEGFEKANMPLDHENCNVDQVIGQIIALRGLVEGIHRGNFDVEVD